MQLLRYIIFTTIISSLFISCDSSEKNTLAIHSEIKTEVNTSKVRVVSEEFKNYWYNGTAEITSYKLTQERYGELREGTSVNIFVTEDFLPKVQVKANKRSPKNIPVLKLNNTKKYLTGISPYSVMTSTFSPVQTADHALKITHSMQEWCGQVYVQLNNKRGFEIQAHSYFEGEADQKINLPKSWMESDLWNRLRINPQELPTGDLRILPSFEYFRMSHKKIAIHTATGNLVKGDSISVYSLSYTDLNRELKIYFSSDFPYTIERWEETHANGLKTIAVKMKRMRSAYWGQNSNKYLSLRDSLGLGI
ncbi:MAG: septum formation inhibitor Maf [Flavobacteriaceae bacterium]|nr:septum formation inhibitor Maf [Flavobacteriaceae bacterium]